MRILGSRCSRSRAIFSRFDLGLRLGFRFWFGFGLLRRVGLGFTSFWS